MALSDFLQNNRTPGEQLREYWANRVAGLPRRYTSFCEMSGIDSKLEIAKLREQDDNS